VLYFNEEPNIKEIINLSSNKSMHFHYKNGRLFILDSILNYNLNEKYKIVFNNKISIINVSIKENGLLNISSEIKSTGYINLQIYNSVFAKFLHYAFKIEYGIGNNKTYNINFPFEINKLSDDILKEIINIVISCEGHITNQYRSTRAIVIKIASKRYLEKFQKILSRFEIESKIGDKTSENLYILHVFRKNNLIKVNNLIKLYIKSKEIRLNDVMRSYLKNRYPNHEATINYLSILKKYSPTDLKRLSRLTDKKYNTLISVFDRLDKQGFIKKWGKRYTGKGNTPWVYDLSKKGKDQLKVR
jgi:hypothetical protein